MKYQVGDKVKIRKDLVVGDTYDGLLYVTDMAREVAKNDNNALVITNTWKNDQTNKYFYSFRELLYTYSEEMIEGLAEELEPTDREKFETWMRALSELNLYRENDVWCAFNDLTLLSANVEPFEKNLKIVADYLFEGIGKKKKMTKAEIEAELGYEIDIVEE